MKKLPILLCLSTFFASCKKEVFNVELPLDDVKAIQSPISEFSGETSEYFSFSINYKLHNNQYYYSFVLDNPKEEINDIKVLLVDSDNRGYISFFGYDKSYSLITGNKKESNTRVIGININFHYSFSAPLFKLYSYFKINNEKVEIKCKISSNIKE